MDFLTNTKSFLKFWNIYCFKTSLQRNGLSKNRVWKGGRHYVKESVKKMAVDDCGRVRPSWKMDNYQMEKMHFLWQKSCNIWCIYHISIYISYTLFHSKNDWCFPFSCFMWSFSIITNVCLPNFSLRPPPSSDTFGRLPRVVSHAFHWTCPGNEADISLKDQIIFLRRNSLII